jgi:hypothetical protein
MNADRDALLAELHRRRAAIDAEIAEVYAGGASKPKRVRRAVVPTSEAADPSTVDRVSRALVKRGIR